MIRQTINIFLKRQHMDHSGFEIYNYSDAEIPKVFPHKHEFYEIYYLLCESVDYSVGNQIYHLKKGDFLLLPPGQLHYPSRINLGKSENYARIVLWLQIDFFETFVHIDRELNQMWNTVIENNVFQFHPSAGNSAHLLDLLLRLLNERSQKEPASTAMAYSILLEIFVLIDRSIHHTARFEQHTPGSRMFDNIIYYIHAHITEDLSLETLSGHFFVSKGYISRLFREYMGIPVHQYILSLRLEGCQKAIQSGTSITDAADLYGFCDYSNFYRAFKAAFQISPRQYQKACLSQNKPSV